MDELINKDWSWETALENYKNDLFDSGEHADTSIRVRMDLLRRIAVFAKQNKVLSPSRTNKTLLSQYFKKRKLGNNTRTVQKRYLVHFYAFLEKEFVVLDNFAELLPAPKIKTKERIIPTVEEIEAIYRAVLDQPKPELISRDLVIVDLLIVPALRVSELVSLRIKDVFFDKIKILVTRKGGNQQLLPVQEETLGHIEEMLEYRNDYSQDDFLLLTTNKRKGRYQPFSIRSVQKLIQKYLLNNVSLNKLSYGPHLLRHFGGSMMERENGVSITQKMLGHKNIETTMIYTHVNQEDLADAVLGSRNYSTPMKE